MSNTIQTETFILDPNGEGIWSSFYKEFCPALHLEMPGYERYSPRGSNVPTKWSLDGEQLNFS